MKRFFSMISSAVLAAAFVMPTYAVEATVMSALKVESYTYVEVFREGKTAWIVVDLMDLQPGAKVKYDEGTQMDNFYSKFLNRTFPQVMFVSDFSVLSEKK
ncbi:MAG: hypothetical protein COY49_13390 [Comamonadaceae bacterium CG_4_10_14_0_8_um_filter_57_29]|nr:MAG: hypothetical protein AUK51_16650 [Comamonadaceae bacterium CG2_30_59_20]PIZ21512.1 MAG: hypothetical protein COY49_13390 [Comamonadaceae bacterium CG_4_10_14_0_8_um_filter_57_29]